jgi:integrase
MTRDHHAGALRGFGKWLEQTGRWDRDPFHRLRVRTANRDKFRVFKRVSFRFEEAERLVEAVWARHEAEVARGGMQTTDGYEDAVRDRQVLYWFVLTTGFRAKECASILWEDVTLDGKLAVRLAGKFTKNGDDALVPLQPFVAEALRSMRARRSTLQMRRGKGAVLQTDPVFKMPDKPAEIVRKDAAFAGLIPQKSPTAKRVDFHCLRKSCARILTELGLHPKIIQQVLRHSDIRLTMDLYGELGEDDLFRELPGKFPVQAMFAKSAPRNGAVATATARAIAAAGEASRSRSDEPRVHGMPM